MFIPLGDIPNPKNYTPWGNWFLIVVNVAIYLLLSRPLTGQAVSLQDPTLQEYLHFIAPRLYHNLSLSYLLQHISSYDLFVFAHGYKSGAPQLNDLFSSLFLHGSFIHLAGNMFFLWIYGTNVEYRLGHLLYLLLYLFCGVAATLFFAAFASSSMTPLIGASGAISGILGLYFIFFPHNQIKVFIAFFPFFFNVVRLPARLVLGFYLLVDNLLPFLGMRGGGIAHGAHIGGFLAGLFCAWSLLKLQKQIDYDDL